MKRVIEGVMNPPPRDSKLRRGFTIIEMLVVMTVLGILATAAMPLVELTAKRSRERELKQAVWEIRRAIDAYKSASDAGHIAKAAGTNGYPATLALLAGGIPDATSIDGRVIYFIRRIPRDPFAPPGIHAEDSWGLRSYSSSDEEPKAGADVFDIYSTSDGVGMNGVPYRLW